MCAEVDVCVAHLADRAFRQQTECCAAIDISHANMRAHVRLRAAMYGAPAGAQKGRGVLNFQTQVRVLMSV